jgi:signal transduction histidine kinase
VLDLQSISSADALSEVVESAKTIVARKGVTISLEIEDADQIVPAYKPRLRQIL